MERMLNVGPPMPCYWFGVVLMGHPILSYWLKGCCYVSDLFYIDIGLKGADYGIPCLYLDIDRGVLIIGLFASWYWLEGCCLYVIFCTLILIEGCWSLDCLYLAFDWRCAAYMRSHAHWYWSEGCWLCVLYTLISVEMVLNMRPPMPW